MISYSKALSSLPHRSHLELKWAQRIGFVRLPFQNPQGSVNGVFVSMGSES